MKEVPTYRCKTYQLQIDIHAYRKEPLVQNGRVLGFWEAHPEHWYYRDLEDVLCDQMVFRMNEMCPSCSKRQWAWQQEQYRLRKAQRAAGGAGQ